jgi:ABC-type molybdenum transport system ATPase subunit/photorepair protein PhrA
VFTAKVNGLTALPTAISATRRSGGISRSAPASRTPSANMVDVRLKEIYLKAFKRFTDTHIQELPASARLIVLAGPNGSGKSSLFDGLKTWHWANGCAGGIPR